MTVTGFQCLIGACWSHQESFCWLWIRIKPLVTGTGENKCLSDPRTNGFTWHSNVWLKRKEKIEADWKKRDIYTFLKAFVKTDYVFSNTRLKKTTSGVFYLKKLSLSVNQNAISVVFHIAFTASVKADTEERGFPRQQWCLCIVHV